MTRSMPRKAPTPRLDVAALGPIREASLEFGDLTVLVGPQASGKSILLQSLKLVLDHATIAATLRRQGYDWRGELDAFLDLYFGEGMRNLRGRSTTLKWKGRAFKLDRLARARAVSGAVASAFYIPAHRALTLKQGWLRNFGDYSPGDPFVVRDFSENLRLLMESGLGRGEAVFPQGGHLSRTARALLQRGIFGDYELRLERRTPQQRLVLRRGNEEPLPFMVWSSGQREFSTLLLGLYHLMPARSTERSQGVDWVILEEPEMGLHPRAITAVLFLVLELLHRGYRVCLSTHSPQFLDLVWALRVFTERSAKPGQVLKLFDIPADARNRAIAADVLGRSIRVYACDRQLGTVIDISRLDPGSPEHTEFTWGGLIEFSTRVSDIVADFVANT
jgi:energy-coupling factor transporter ATP-binding protein EcfA2